MNENFLHKINKKHNLITVLGPTAGGKTSFAAHLALLLNSEIISADSRQVYKKMDIGTGKDLSDYFIDGKTIPYHLIDIVDAGEKYNLFRFQKDFFSAYSGILQKGKIPVLCGGTGLYIDAIIKNYKLIEVPENKKLRTELETKSLEELTVMLKSIKKLHNTSEIDTKKRVIRSIEIEIYTQNRKNEISRFPQINSFNIGIKFNREIQKQRITYRLEQRSRNGMIEEVQNLINSGISQETLIYYGLEYKFITLYLQKKLSYDEMKEKLNIAIHQFSKRQMTFFRRMERQGTKIWWLDGNLSLKNKISTLNEIIKKNAN